MADILSKLRQRNRLHATLKSGLSIAYHLPDSKRCIIDADELDRSPMRKGWECRQMVCAEMLDAIEGEELTERDDRWAILAAMTPEERDELYDLSAPAPVAEVANPQNWDEAGELNRQAWLEGAR